MRLRQTLEGGWVRSDFSPVVRWKDPRIYTLTGRDLGVEGNPLLERVGPKLVEMLGARRAARGHLGFLERSLKDDSFVSSDT